MNHDAIDLPGLQTLSPEAYEDNWKVLYDANCGMRANAAIPFYLMSSPLIGAAVKLFYEQKMDRFIENALVLQKPHAYRAQKYDNETGSDGYHLVQLELIANEIFIKPEKPLSLVKLYNEGKQDIATTDDKIEFCKTIIPLLDENNLDIETPCYGWAWHQNVVQNYHLKQTP